LTPSATDKTAKLVPIEQVLVDESIQIRAAVDPKTITLYRALIREHGNMDPIHLFRHGDSTYLVGDGFERIEAYRQEGKLEIPAKIHDGTASDILKYAILANCHHGARMTNADKRRSAKLAVEDERLGDLTDTAIAKMIGVSVSLVGEVRRGETREVKKKKVAQRIDKREASTKGVTTRERKEPDNRPTKAMLLAQIREHVRLDVLEEADLVGLLETKSAEYKFLPKVGEKIGLRIVGKNGRVMVELPVTIVKDLKYEQIVLKLEDGKVGLVD